jgi:hypothetical protein
MIFKDVVKADKLIIDNFLESEISQ